MKICAATGNAGKLRELRRILEAQGHEVVSQKELGITIEPEETGTTFAENALIKAETICKASGLPTIADDSGLCVDFSISGTRATPEASFMFEIGQCATPVCVFASTRSSSSLKWMP